MASYIAAYLDGVSNKVMKPFVSKETLHMTIFFDRSDAILGLKFPEFSTNMARIAKIAEWPVGDSIYIVAELDNSDWSFAINDFVKSYGIKEDLPHKPHITLKKNALKGDSADFLPLVGEWLTFKDIKLKEVKKVVA